MTQVQLATEKKDMKDISDPVINENSSHTCDMACLAGQRPRHEWDALSAYAEDIINTAVRKDVGEARELDCCTKFECLEVRLCIRFTTWSAASCIPDNACNRCTAVFRSLMQDQLLTALPKTGEDRDYLK
jgi:hypothetical protein